MNNRQSIYDGNSALSRLMKGNQAYLTAAAGTGDISEQIRIHTHENGQSPYAIIIACSDSRVIPEQIFMTGIGELFVIRVAGNVIGDFELGSIEYAAAHLGSKLILVLGHSHCGAVHAAIHNSGHDSIQYITKEIQKAIGSQTDTFTCEKLNVRHSMDQILKSPLIQEMMEQNKLKLAGAHYDTRSGKVTLL